MHRTPLVLRSLAAAAALLALSCTSDLSLPAEPRGPVLTDFAPLAAFADQVVTIHGTGFEAVPEHNEVIFEEGHSTQAFEVGDGYLRVRVPPGLQTGGALIVATSLGKSAPTSEQFDPLGTGHPNEGTLVASISFRHRPAGIVDTESEVVVASTLFDLVLSERGPLARTAGRPVAFGRSGDAGRLLLSSRDGGSGKLSELDLTTGAPLARSADDERVEALLLPRPRTATDGPLAHSLGTDARGRWWLSRWTRTGAALAAERQPLEVTTVLGAAAAVDGKAVTLVAERLVGGRMVRGLLQVDDSGAAPAWLDTADLQPTGAIAIVPLADTGTVTVVGTSDGDLAVLEAGATTWRRIVLTSSAAIGAMAGGLHAGQVVFTKPHEGALYSADVAAGAIRWSVQVRGEPALLDVSPEADEVAVTNAADNVVDVVSAETGQWLGRADYTLGLGSVDSGAAGVAPYAYLVGGDTTSPERMLFLARNAGYVLAIEPSALTLLAALPLDAAASPALRLAQTSDHKVLVLHRSEVGLLDGAGEQRLLSHLAAEPLDAVSLPGGRLAIGSATAVDVYDWKDGGLVRTGGSTLPDGMILSSLFVAGGQLVLVATGPSAAATALRLTPEAARTGAAPEATFSADTYGGFLGAFAMGDGPALFFARGPDGKAAMLPFGAWFSPGDAVSSIVTRPRLLQASPDGRYVAWSDDGSGERLIRVVQRYEHGGVDDYSTYRVDAAPTGVVFDPSGQYMFAPLPDLDRIEVFQ